MHSADHRLHVYHAWSRLARAAVRASSRHYSPNGRLQCPLDNNAPMAYLYGEEVCQWRSDSVGMID